MLLTLIVLCINNHGKLLICGFAILTQEKGGQLAICLWKLAGLASQANKWFWMLNAARLSERLLALASNAIKPYYC